MTSRREIKGKIADMTYFECKICGCSFSGHCDWKELATHIEEDHEQPGVWLLTPEENLNKFNRRIHDSVRQQLEAQV